MKVKELRPESKVDVIELTIRQKGEARDFSSRSGSTGKVADAKAVDDEGTEVSVSLWNEEIERVQANDRIRITNGWVREWRGNMQVSAGRFGNSKVYGSIGGWKIKTGRVRDESGTARRKRAAAGWG